MLLEWTMQFHATISNKDGTVRQDMYVVKRSTPGTPIMTVMVPQGDRELPMMLQKALNGYDVSDAEVNKQYATTLTRIFYGPWEINDTTGVRFVRVSEEEETKIKRIIYKETAERIMAEANLAALRKEYTALNRAHQLQGQALLRARATPPSAFHGGVFRELNEAETSAIENELGLFDTPENQTALPLIDNSNHPGQAPMCGER